MTSCVHATHLKAISVTQLTVFWLCIPEMFIQMKWSSVCVCVSVCVCKRITERTNVCQYHTTLFHLATYL